LHVCAFAALDQKWYGILIMVFSKFSAGFGDRLTRIVVLLVMCTAFVATMMGPIEGMHQAIRNVAYLCEGDEYVL
jgi:hypothetical protein